MDKKMDDIKYLSQKLEDLDNELNTFFQSVKEIKEIRDTVASLPENLKKREIEITHQKQELEQLMFSTNNLLMSFEEKTKGLFFDLEQKANILMNDVRLNVSQLKALFQFANTKLKNEQIKNLEHLSEEHKRLETYRETTEKLELTFEENKKYLNELENKIFKREEALKTLFFSKLEKQKRLILIMTITFMVVVFFLILFFK